MKSLRIAVLVFLISVPPFLASADVVEIPIHRDVLLDEEIDIIESGSLMDFWEDYYIHTVSVYYSIEDDTDAYAQLFINDKFFSSQEFLYNPCCFRKFYPNSKFSQIGKSIKRMKITFHKMPFFVYKINVEVEKTQPE